MVKNNLEGCVKLQFFVNSNGTPVYIEPIKSSTGDIFDNSAIEALSKWRYQPAQNNPKHTPERLSVKLDFVIAENFHEKYHCHADMTIAPNTLAAFREKRLSQPIIANDLMSLSNSIKAIETV